MLSKKGVMQYWSIDDIKRPVCSRTSICFPRFTLLVLHFKLLRSYISYPIFIYEVGSLQNLMDEGVQSFYLRPGNLDWCCQHKDARVKLHYQVVIFNYLINFRSPFLPRIQQTPRGTYTPQVVNTDVMNYLLSKILTQHYSLRFL